MVDIEVFPLVSYNALHLLKELHHPLTTSEVREIPSADLAISIPRKNLGGPKSLKWKEELS